MRGLIVLAVAASLAACATKPQIAPQAPPAIEVVVPVPVPCQVAQVAPSRLPTASRPRKADLYDRVKLILADRAVLKADRARLAAANSNPCPEVKTQ